MVPNGSCWYGGRKGESFRIWRRDVRRKTLDDIVEEIISNTDINDFKRFNISHYYDYSFYTLRNYLSCLERGKGQSFDSRPGFWNFLSWFCSDLGFPVD